MIWNGISLLLLLSAISSGVLSVFLFTRWRTRGARTLSAYMAAVAVWSGTGVMELVVQDPSHSIHWASVGAMGFAVTVPLFLVFTLIYTGREQWLTGPWKAYLWALPLGTVVIIATSHWNHLFYALDPPELWSHRNAISQYGPAMWVGVVYSYTGMFIANMLLWASSRTGSPALRLQLRVLMLSTLLPFVSGGLYLLDLPLLHGVDFSSTGFGLMGLVLAWALYKHRLLELAPLGRTMLQRHMPDGMVLLDPQGRVVDVNPSAQRLLKVSGQALEKLLLEDDTLSALLKGEEEQRAALALAQGDLHVELHMVPLQEEGGPRLGRLLLLHDVTARVKAEHSREQVIRALQQALGDIRVLRGMLPICSGCKKIRDDGGYWRQIEVYIRDHTDAEFSHSLCPDCVAQLYPDLDLDTPPESV